MSKRVLAASKPAVAWLIENMVPIVGTPLPGTDREVGHSGWSLLAYLADCSNTGNGRVWMTADTMTRNTGIDKTSRDRYLAGFRSLGWLVEVGRQRMEGAKGGSGSPVYVLALVPALAQLNAEAEAASMALTEAARSTSERMKPVSTPSHTPNRGDEKRENVNNDGEETHTQNPYPYPYPGATDAPTGELGQVVPMSRGEKKSLYHQVLAHVMDLEPTDAPERKKGARRTYLENEHGPTIAELVAPHLDAPDTWDDTLIMDLAHQAMDARKARKAGGNLDAIRERVRKAAGSNVPDDEVCAIIATAETRHVPDLVAIAQDARPGFTWDDARHAQERRAVGDLVRGVAGRTMR